MPAKLTYRPSSTQRAGRLGAAGERMHHAGQRAAAAGLFEHRHHVGLALAGMHDERQPGLLREANVAIEIILLQFERGVVPMPIEARFAERDDARPIDERDDAIPIARLRLHACSWDECRRRRTVAGFGSRVGDESQHVLAACRRDGDADHALRRPLHEPVEARRRDRRETRSDRDGSACRSRDCQSAVVSVPLQKPRNVDLELQLTTDH